MKYLNKKTLVTFTFQTFNMDIYLRKKNEMTLFCKCVIFEERKKEKKRRKKKKKRKKN